MTTRIGVVGCGFFAQNHLHGWKTLESEGAKLVGVCDAMPEKAQSAGARFGAASHTDLDALIEQTKPDLVDVVTRMDTHKEICAKLAARGIGAIVQKPLAPSWDDCVAMAETARKANVFLAIHENFRFQKPMLKVKELLDQGVVGDINWARIAFRTGFDVFGNQPYLYNEERLVILDVGIHVLDLARVFLGEVSHLSCETQKRNARVRADDTATMLLRHHGGIVSAVECTYMAKRHPDPFPQTRLEIEGAKGSLILESDDRIVLSDGASSRVIDIENPLDSWMERPWHVVQRSVVETSRQLLRAFRRGERGATDIADNLKTYGLVEAAYRAAGTNSVQAPPRWEAQRGA